MRHILHADFDAFYASVEQLDNPELRGKPLAVGGSPESRGVVAAASYEAREYGIRSAMPMRTAFQKCPNLLRVGARFGRYREVSRQVMDIFNDVTPLMEPLSLDEAYLDITDEVSAERTAEDLARSLKQRVKRELGLTISVGVGSSKSVAKIASDLDKPDGLTVVPPSTETSFLAPLPVSNLPGVGPKTQERLRAEGVVTVGDLAEQSDEWLTSRFGRNGAYMKRLATGRDDRPVETSRDTKSVSSETTLIRDTGDPEALQELVNRLSQDVSRSLERRAPMGANREGEAQAVRLYDLHSPGDAFRGGAGVRSDRRSGWSPSAQRDWTGQDVQARGCRRVRIRRQPRSSKADRPAETARDIEN